MKKFFPYLIIICITAMMIAFPAHTIAYAKNGLDMCASIIMPSLFPFFVCSGLLVYSGFTESLSEIFRPVMKPLFNISSCGAPAFVLGIISGYPLGAVTACQLYDSGYLSQSETERLLAFCNNSGPLFILGAVGTSIYASGKIGAMLYLSHIVSAICVGIAFRFYKKSSHTAPDYKIKRPEESFQEVFSKVLTNSVSNILTVCGAIVFFSAISGVVLDFLPADGVQKSFIWGILELTGGVKNLSMQEISITEKLVLSAFVVGFAGLCVHLQVMAVAAKYHLSLAPYIFGKIMHGTLAAIFTYILLKIFPQTQAVLSSCEKSLGKGFYISSVFVAAAIIFMTLTAMLIIIFTRLLKDKINEGKSCDKMLDKI